MENGYLREFPPSAQDRLGYPNSFNELLRSDFFSPLPYNATHDLLDGADETGRTRAKIGKSNVDVIKFKTIAHKKTDLGVDSLPSWVTKATIRKNKTGFLLKGKERSRVLGIFGKRHSKFTCRFTEQR